MMRVVFIGTVTFSWASLSRCINLGAHVVGVVTRKSSTFNSDFADLEPLARKYNIPVQHTTNVNSKESVDWIRDKNPDAIFCFGWSSLLTQEILSIPPIGVIGFHPAALPQNRGRHPIIWALALGLKSTASTFFFMDNFADSGDILSQESVLIDYEDDALSLYSKITSIALSQIEMFLPCLATGNATRIKQDNNLSNSWRKRRVEDGCLDFRMSSRSVYNLVRALTRPYPGAHLRQGDQEIKVWRSREAPCVLENMEPGKVLSADSNGILVKCGEGAILLTEHEFEQIPTPGEYLQ